MNTVEVGYFSKAHGLKGQLLLKPDKEFYFEELNVLFVEINGARIPYFVKSASETNHGLLLLLEDHDSIEKVKLLVGKKVFVDEQLLIEEDAYDYSGYTIKDMKEQVVGLIESVEDHGSQLIAVLKINNKEVMLPLAEELIREIDDGDKTIVYDLPEGLLDVYLKEGENLEEEH